MGVRRVYVEKKPQFAVKAKELREEIVSYLGIGTVCRGNLTSGQIRPSSA